MSPAHWIATGAISAAIAVALGAFGAHGLEERVTPDDLEIWKTGVHYHFLHAIGLVLLGLFLHQRGTRAPVAGWCFLAGQAVFAGTLYAMVLGGPRVLGAITPIGGVLLIVGWLAFARSALRSS